MVGTVSAQAKARGHNNVHYAPQAASGSPHYEVYHTSNSTLDGFQWQLHSANGTILLTQRNESYYYANKSTVTEAVNHVKMTVFNVNNNTNPTTPEAVAVYSVQSGSLEYTFVRVTDKHGEIVGSRQVSNATEGAAYKNLILKYGGNATINFNDGPAPAPSPTNGTNVTSPSPSPGSSPAPSPANQHSDLTPRSFVWYESSGKFFWYLVGNEVASGKGAVILEINNQGNGTLNTTTTRFSRFFTMATTGYATENEVKAAINTVKNADPAFFSVDDFNNVLVNDPLTPGALLGSKNYPTAAEAAAGLKEVLAVAPNASIRQRGGGGGGGGGSSSDDDSGLSGGAIAGIVIGCIAGVALLGAAAYFVTQKKSSAPPASSPYNTMS